MNADGADRGRAGRSAPAWLLDRAFAIRPLLWIPAVAVYGAGRAWEFREAGREGFRPGPLAALLLILAAVHAANAWRDRDGDRLNRKSLPVGRGRVGGRSLLALILGSILAAVLLTRGRRSRSRLFCSLRSFWAWPTWRRRWRSSEGRSWISSRTAPATGSWPSCSGRPAPAGRTRWAEWAGWTDSRTN